MEYLKELINIYPDAIQMDILMNAVEVLLKKYGENKNSILFGNSTCPDEVNRLILALADRWGENFSLGGLAGFPFTGKTGFNAYSSHVPDNGSMFIVYASHVGINKNGKLGKILRRGMKNETFCCGSAMEAYDSVIKYNNTDFYHDRQQHEVGIHLKKHIIELEKDDFTMDKLPEIIFHEIDQMIRKLIQTEVRKKVYIMGGIQVNTHYEDLDYFIPKIFEVYDPIRKKHTDIKQELDKLLEN